MAIPIYKNNIDNFIADLSNWYNTSGQNKYDEVVTIKDHMLQAAHIAYDENLQSASIISCLFHDIGHMIIDDTDEPSGLKGNEYHETIAAHYLSNLFIDDVIQPVKNHVRAKRWLCSTDVDYYDQLSPASKQSFNDQGGYMTKNEIQNFESSKYFDISIKVRRIDDRAKIKDKVTYPIKFYREQILDCLRI